MWSGAKRIVKPVAAGVLGIAFPGGGGSSSRRIAGYSRYGVGPNLAMYSGPTQSGKQAQWISGIDNKALMIGGGALLLILVTRR